MPQQELLRRVIEVLESAGRRNATGSFGGGELARRLSLRALGLW